MNRLRKFLAVAATSAALGVAAFAAVPAAAQGWADDGPPPGRDPYQRPPPWGPYGYETDAGVMDIAICPPGYHLGRSGRLCWPN
jgi:hypothetical protein